MTNSIKHRGTVENIGDFYLKVRIVQVSACASCSVRGHCSASESKEKLIDVFDSKGLAPQVGQQVVICGTSSMGLKAVGWAFVLPFAIVVLSLFGAMELTRGDEVTSALISLCMLIPYYIMLYLCRKRLGRTFVFTLESVCS